MKLSVITINLNNVTGLCETIKSIINQTFSDYEFIIIDGGSTDSSVKVIEEYSDKIAFWVSEPDSGIYSAMNKGIKKAHGEYCLFLNSGDSFAENNIVKECFDSISNEDLIYGNVIFNHGIVQEEYKLPSELSFYHFFTDSIAHASTFIRRELFDKIGYYNESFKIVSDWEFFIKSIFINRCSLKYLNLNIAKIDVNGISRTNRDLCRQERAQVLNEYFPRFLVDYEKLKGYQNITPVYSKTRSVRLFVKVLNYLILFWRKYKKII